MRVRATAAVFIGILVLANCGGTAAPAPAASSGPSGSPTGNTSSTSTPSVGTVTVAAGLNAIGTDIAVAAPSASPAPNAEDLGVASMSGAGSAYNTGDVIHRGQTARVLLFGPGLNADMKVTIRGPSDITVSNVTSIKSTNNTSGIAFTASVSSAAALGARTVVLQNTQGDITTFTGGLEVAP